MRTRLHATGASRVHHVGLATSGLQRTLAARFRLRCRRSHRLHRRCRPLPLRRNPVGILLVERVPWLIRIMLFNEKRFSIFDSARQLHATATPSNGSSDSGRDSRSTIERPAIILGHAHDASHAEQVQIAVHGLVAEIRLHLPLLRELKALPLRHSCTRRSSSIAAMCSLAAAASEMLKHVIRANRGGTTPAAACRQRPSRPGPPPKSSPPGR